MPNTLFVATTTFFNRQPIADVTAVTFTNARGTTAQAIFSGSQISLGHLSSTALITGSGGVNQLVFSGNHVNAGNFTFANWAASDLVWIKGTSGDNWLGGSAVSDRIEGLDGNDEIAAYSGTSVLADTLLGGAGNDFIRMDHAGVVDGGADVDTWWARLDAASPAGVIDIRDGGGGRVLSFGLALQNIEMIDLELGDGHDSVWGGALNDSIAGGKGNDLLNGEAGNDYLRSGEGLDTLLGGIGDDRLSMAGAGASVADGGEGNDWIVLDLRQVATGQVIDLRDGGGGRVVGATQVLNIEGLLGHASLGDDVIWGGSQSDVFSAHDGNDLIHGGDGADDLNGGRGRDTILGEGGNDYLTAAGAIVPGGLAANRDSMDGGDGDDVLESGRGRQDMWGGTGADEFAFYDPASLDKGTNADRIYDFEHGIDHLDFVTDLGYPGLDGIVHFIGASTVFTSGLTTQARVVTTATETVLVLGNSLLGVIGEIHFGQIVTLDLGDFIGVASP